jgi:hypothetical protein
LRIRQAENQRKRQPTQHREQQAFDQGVAQNNWDPKGLKDL